MVAALVSVGADPAKADAAWVKNHFGLVVWKLASLEQSFPNDFGCRALTWLRVLAQLRYRYEREVVRGHKSPIWSLLAGAAPADSAMVLLVCELQGSDKAVVSDGWYSLACKLDPALAHFAATGRLAVGDKVAVGGAVLEGGSGPLKGHPLHALRHALRHALKGHAAAGAPADDDAGEEEAPKPPTLAVHANGVRRAAWDAKLGFLPRPALRVGLRGILGSGGLVPSVDVVVVRSYPPLWRAIDPTTGAVSLLGEHEEQKANDAHQRRYAAIFC
jgi:breast cancer 2 susceptibility protein